MPSFFKIAQLRGGAAGLMAAGFFDTTFGNLIRAAVSRQREFLADASAVQFTRQPSGQVPQAAVACVAADRTVTAAEAELLRAISASIGCPMPPLLLP